MLAVPVSGDTDADRRRIVAPYVVRWSEERDLPSALVESHSGGIAYLDEVLTDRDDRGVLWCQVSSRPRQGRPMFGKVHPLRQRRAMRRLLCQVCGGPADRNDDGVLWLLMDHRDDWPEWPNRMAADEPPVCVECVRLSVRLCPALRKGAAAIRVREYPAVGVRGRLYKSDGLVPVFVEETITHFNDPAARWIQAGSLLRELHGCEIVPFDQLG